MGEGGRPARWAASLWETVWTDRPSALSVLFGEEQARVVTVRAASLWGIVVCVAAMVLVLLPHGTLTDVRRVPAFAVAVGGFLLSAVLVRTKQGMSDTALLLVLIPTFGAMVAMVWLLGPGLEVAIVALVAADGLVFLFVGRRTGLVANVLAVALFCGLVLLEDGYPAPHLHIIIVTVTIVASACVTGWIVRHIERLSVQERDAQAKLAVAHQELAELNRQLEERVDAQGEEIGSLRRLRQFLAPQVAEAVLRDGIEALVPHRCRIAVVFCDLRGFTSFSSSAEPEEVMEVLDCYYVTVGRALHRADATVGTFAGDGIMAYFGDPVPHHDPAGTAVRMAIELRGPMGEVSSAWRRRGFDLGCGIGIAYGYATIGPVGFEERTDYTALGPTVNLASRLCSLAADGEVLIDGRAHEAVEGRVRGVERTLEVRGYREPVRAFDVLEWIEAREPEVSAGHP